MATKFERTKLAKFGLKIPKGKFNTLPPGGAANSGSVGNQNNKYKLAKKPTVLASGIKYTKLAAKKAGPTGRIVTAASIASNLNRLSKVTNTTGFTKAEKVIVKVAKEGRKVVTKVGDSGKKVYNKVKDKLATRKKTKTMNKAKKQILKNMKTTNINRLTSKVRTKPFDGKQYQGKPMSKRNKVFATVGLGLAGAELVRNSINANKKVNDPKPQFGSVNTKTTGRESEMTSPHSTKTKVTTPKNPKMTYKRPVAGEDFPKYNNSTGGNYAVSGTQKDDELMKTRYRAGPSMTGFKSNSLRKAGSFKGKNVTYTKDTYKKGK